MLYVIVCFEESPTTKLGPGIYQTGQEIKTCKSGLLIEQDDKLYIESFQKRVF